MVYPPPQPQSAYIHAPPFYQYGDTKGVSLPSMGSWAPPPAFPSPHIAQSSPGWGSGPPPTNFPGWRDQGVVLGPQPAKRPRISKSERRPSDDVDVQAGLALAKLGLAMPPEEIKARRQSTSLKKVRKEEEKPVKDGRKSCSECRRLKAKCDRVFPCSNCRRRGCALVCPDGDLSCMQGKRLVLASTEQLHDRIAQLEAALSQIQSGTSTTHHPLLGPENLDGGFASVSPPEEQLLSLTLPSRRKHSVLERDVACSPKGMSSASTFTLATPNPMDDHLSNSQGRMAVGSLLLCDIPAAPEGTRDDEWVGENAASALIVGSIGSPDDDGQSDCRLIVERLKNILRILPPREETRSRVEGFWSTSAWYNSVLCREEFDTIYEPAVYAPTPANPLSPHKLACVLIVLTLVAYFDLTNSEEDPAIAVYWEGVQKCFDTRFGWSASVPGVQALALVTHFLGFGWRGARSSSFYWVRQMTSAAQQLGLHKDPHPSLPEDEREFRRKVFWEAYSIDCLICCNHGQHTAVPVDNIEARLPTKNITPFQLVKYNYMRDVKSRVVDVGCRSDLAPASWDDILSIDAHLMSVDVVSIPEIHCPLISGGPLPVASSDPSNFNHHELDQCITSMCHYKAMLVLYRPSLRRLVARLRSQAFSSITFNDADHKTVSMTHKACHAITATALFMTRTHPRLSERLWSVSVQAFSSTVSMAALALWCSPHLDPDFIHVAYKELCDACDVISGAKRQTGVMSLLPMLKSLVRSRYPQIEGEDLGFDRRSIEGEDMLFALLGGQIDQEMSPRQDHPLQLPRQPPMPESTDARHPPKEFAELYRINNWQVNLDDMTLSIVDNPAQIMTNSDVARATDLSATELWARLQSLYDPALA
ncbi:MAG: hypothetical protein TREMPRED_000005 [Tremellales sp. Tagirdzhanova-0007]|nr:MAG: hypothetical protein TREMPRED_000005 [Tremellales sp. Tagirdzhanova-0007]